MIKLIKISLAISESSDIIRRGWRGSMTNNPVPDPSKGTRERSPAFPYIGLGEALDRARQFHKIERKVAAPVHVAVKHWGYREKSSGGIQTIAALKAFGLMNDVGSGADRKVQLSDFGLDIIQDERLDSPERDQLIKRAALLPKIHATLWNKYKTELPSPDNLRHELKKEFKFNPNAIDDFLMEYKDTISFAKLTGSDTVSSEVNDGDKDHGTYIPLGALNQKLPPNNRMKEDVFSLSEGRVVIQWPAPLSANSIQDVKDWLKIVERKIARSVTSPEESDKS
jgi:hypothetical protein